MAKTGYDAVGGWEAQVRAVEAEVAGVMGVVNAANGRLVELVADGLDGDLWSQWGIHTPAHWVAWQTGMTAGRADGVVALAARRSELPCTIAAVVAGELALDAAVAIGRHAPADYEQSICAFAKQATMSQLSRCLRRYTYDPETEKTRPKPVEAESSFTSGIDDVGWFGNLRLPVEDGLVYEQAVRAAREQLYAQNQADAPEGEKPEPVSNADAIVGLAESFLRNGQAALPGSERFQVLLHLETAVNQPDGPGILTYGTGPRLPEAVRRLLLCGCSVAPVWEAHGSPLSVGRAQRVLSRRMRRLVEHRDGHACRIPGCGRRLGLEVHHIVHWEDGGATDTANLVSLCRRHHRLHHQGLLGIDGNADPIGDLVVTDRWGHALDPAGSPIRPARGSTPIEAAEAAGIVPGDYTHPLGERLDHAWVTFNPNPGVHLDVSGNVPPPIPLRPPAPEPGIDEPGAPAAGAAPPAA